MQPAGRALVGARATGDPLPEIPELSELKRVFDFAPRRGQLLMVAGQPGSQKSGLALWMVQRWNLPTLYVSADMAQHTAVVRLASLVTGHTKSTVAQGLDVGADGYYQEVLADLPITFCFDSAPDLEDVHEELDAYVELYDAWPDVIVIDNLMNVTVDHENEWSGLRLVLIELHALARMTGAAVVVLHHMSEAVGKSDVPMPRRALHGKVSQLPEVILSIAVDPAESSLKVAVVKNRDGRADASADRFIRLSAEMDKTRFLPWTGRYQGMWGGYADDED